MKKILLTLITGITFYNCANAQLVNAYGFSQSSGTYTPITGGLVLGDTAIDDQVFLDPAALAGNSTFSGTTGVGFPIGFNFTYNGIIFDRLAINTNGWISLGQSSLTPAVNINSSSGFELPLSKTSTATPALLRNRIGGLAMDLRGQNGSELRIETLGTAPNRVCVVQWKNFKKYGQTSNYNFQIRLNETTNSVVVVYGAFTSNSVSSFKKTQVGLSGTTVSDFNLRHVSNNWAASTAATVNTDTCHLVGTVLPASGQTYTWTVPSACSGTPVAGTAAASVDSVCAGISFDLTLTGYTPGVSGLSFQWQSSSSMTGTFANITSATSATYAAIQTATTYYKCIVTCANGGATATSNTVAVLAKAPTNCYCTLSSTSCTLDDVITNVTIGSLNNTSTCGTAGYSYTASPVPSYNIGETYPVSVTVGDGGTEHVSIWVDYNRNGMFEASEYKYIGSGDDTTIVSTLSIPATALEGQTRMRVRVRFNTALADSMACYSGFSYGETEDYLVNLVDTTSGVGIHEVATVLNNIVVFPNPTNGTFTIAVPNADFNQLTINVIDIQGKVVYAATDKNVNTNYSRQISLDGIAKGLYYVKLITENGMKVQKLVVQ